MKPKVLYHGSTQYKSYLAPSQGIGDGHNDHHMAVYAIADVEIARFFAFQYIAQAPEARFKIDYKNGQACVFLYKTHINWEHIGYLYSLSSQHFIKLEDEQWISNSPVQALNIERVNPRDYIQHIILEDADP